MLLRHTAEITVLAGPDKGQEILGLNGPSQLTERGNRRRVDQRLRVGQHTVHVEDDGLRGAGFGHGVRLTHGGAVSIPQPPARVMGSYLYY